MKFVIVLAMFSVLDFNGAKADIKEHSRETFLESFFFTNMEYGNPLETRRFPMSQGAVAEVEMAELKIEFLARSGGCTKNEDFRVDTYFDFSKARLAIVRVKKDKCKALASPVKVAVTVPMPKYDDDVGAVQILNGTNYSLSGK